MLTLNLHTSKTVEQVGGRWCLRPPLTCCEMFSMCYTFKGFCLVWRLCGLNLEKILKNHIRNPLKFYEEFQKF
eukprot:UN21902